MKRWTRVADEVRPQFLGPPIDEASLRFYKTRRTVHTASGNPALEQLHARLVAAGGSTRRCSRGHCCARGCHALRSLRPSQPTKVDFRFWRICRLRRSTAFLRLADRHLHALSRSGSFRPALESLRATVAGVPALHLDDAVANNVVTTAPALDVAYSHGRQQTNHVLRRPRRRALGFASHVLEKAPSRRTDLGPGEGLGGRVDLIVMASGGKHGELGDVIRKPVRLFRQMDEAVLDGRGLGAQAHDLVAFGLVARDARQTGLDQVLDELSS